MMEQLNGIRELISQGKVEEAIGLLQDVLHSNYPHKDEAYYLLGNAYRKQGNWQQALNHYGQAVELNPQSPALHARRMVMDILEFYNKDMYNQ